MKISGKISEHINYKIPRASILLASVEDTGNNALLEWETHSRTSASATESQSSSGQWGMQRVTFLLASTAAPTQADRFFSGAVNVRRGKVALMKRVVLLCIFALLLASRSSATTYYVDCNAGNDGPWARSIALGSTRAIPFCSIKAAPGGLSSYLRPRAVRAIPSLSGLMAAERPQS